MSKKVYIPTSVRNLSDERLIMLVSKLDKGKTIFNPTLSKAKRHYSKTTSKIRLKTLAKMELDKRTKRVYTKRNVVDLKITLWDVKTKTMVRTYVNISEASKDLAIERPLIYNILNGVKRTANKKQYTFTYNESEPVWSLLAVKYKTRVTKTV